MKIGLFGGSFNPIHNGHIALAQQLRKQAGLDEVWLMVSPQNPLKTGQEMLDDGTRLELVKIALGEKSNTEGLRACDYELHLPKPSYTWNTLQALKKDYPENTFVLLIGGDNWLLFDKWYHAEDIMRNYEIFVYPRRGCVIDSCQLPKHVKVVDTELLDVSSTEIRQRVKDGLDISHLVPESIITLVEKYYV